MLSPLLCAQGLCALSFDILDRGVLLIPAHSSQDCALFLFDVLVDVQKQLTFGSLKAFHEKS